MNHCDPDDEVLVALDGGVDISRWIERKFRRMARMTEDCFDENGFYNPERVTEWCHCGAAITRGLCRFCDRLVVDE